MAEEQLTFDHVDLNQIDPNFSTLPQDMYTLRILKAEKRTYAKKDGSGDGQFMSFNFAVVDHPTLSGRRFYDSLFPSNYAFRVLRRIADFTGIQQNAGEPLEEWLKTLTETQPLIKMLVGYRSKRVKKVDPATGVESWENEVVLNDATGKPQDNAVDWREMQPAE